MYHTPGQHGMVEGEEEKGRYPSIGLIARLQFLASIQGVVNMYALIQWLEVNLD